MSYFPADYAQRVYAGVLGKVIGVYLGRPFEGWTYERIQEQLGDIEYYVHDRLGAPLLVTDDDISGTFTFPRALQDLPSGVKISAAHIGQAWLNYLIEDRTILWWGGMGNSTEHTAYLRLKNGVEAPRSGSAALNGTVVSEQIGAQIFVDGWAMVSPGDPDQAAYLAEQAARVSHDGEAVHAAVVWAVMEAQAFVQNDTNTLLDLALSYIPANSLITKLISDVRSWHAQDPDWRANRELIAAHYGYDKYGGNCHMVPNHGLMVHALLHCEGDFSEGMKIINTCGWDTDCNSGNLGCLLGIQHGLAGIDGTISDGAKSDGAKSAGDAPVDWRGPVADRIYVPTADPSWGISDCAREAVELVNAGQRLQGHELWQPKAGAQFHFEFPGAVQGFTVTHGVGTVINSAGANGRVLQLDSHTGACFGTPLFAPSKAVAKYFEGGGYALMASPRLHPGQTVTAAVYSCVGSCNLYARYYGPEDQPCTVRSLQAQFDAPGELTFTLPQAAHPIFELGVELVDGGRICLSSLSWHGAPSVKLTRPQEAKSTMWRRAWVNGVDAFDSWVEAHRVIQNSGRGLLIQGNREWTDYRVSADVTPHLARAAGIAGRVQGMRRYYALLLYCDQQHRQIRLVCMHNQEQVLASCDFDWQFGSTYQLHLDLHGPHIVGGVDGVNKLHVHDHTLSCGGIGLLVEEGRSGTAEVSVTALN